MSARKPHITLSCSGPSMYSILPLIPELRNHADITILGSMTGKYALTPENALYDLSGIPIIDREIARHLGNHNTDMYVFLTPGSLGAYALDAEKLRAQGTLLCYFPYATEFLGESYAGWVVNQPYADQFDLLLSTAPLGMLSYGKYNPSVLPKVYCFGNPESDILTNHTYERHAAYTTLTNFTQEYPAFLWTPHWMIDEAPYWSGWLTFGAALALFFARHPGCRLIVRPHHRLVEQFANDSPRHRKAQAIMDKLRSLPNVYIDEYSTSLVSIGVADFLISDCSSIIQKFFVTGKPMIVHDTHYGSINHIMDDSTYLVKDPYQLMQHMDNLLAGNDTKKEHRLEYRDSFCGPTDGQCARHIASFLLQEWEQRHQ